MGRVIYMDHHATTPVDPRVLEAMLPYFSEKFGNAASRTHPFGWEAEEAVDRARAQVAAVIGAKPKEIIFTSGATESDNLAIKGVVDFHRAKGDHVITCVTEHNAVLDPCRALERAGLATVTYLPVDEFGLVDPDAVRRAITPRTVLISIMHANNEIGTVHPIAAIGRLAKSHEVLFHCDATQGVGRLLLDVGAADVDLLSFTAHKMHGPKGCGALYVRARGPRVRLNPQMHGGGHERGMRSGTLNVPAIVGFGRACEIAAAEMATEQARILTLRERLWGGLCARLEGVSLSGHPTERLAGNLNASFACVDAEALLAALPDVALSSGSACTSATLAPSHVLRALGLGDDLVQSSVRFGLGRSNTEAEIDYVIERVVHEVGRLRQLSAEWAGRKKVVSC